MNDEMKKELLIFVRWVLVVVVAGAFAYFGFGNIDIPPVPLGSAQTAAPLAVATEEAGEETGDEIDYGYQTLVYMTNGGDLLQVASGGEIDIAEGGTLDVNGTVAVDDLTVEGTLDVAELSSLDGGIAVDAVFTVADATGNMAVFGTSDLRGNISSGAGVLTFTDNALIDGAADAIQLTVQGYTTQTTDLLVLETSAEADVFTVDVDGAVDAAGLASLDGGIDVDGAFTAANTTGNLDTTGTLDVDGLASLDGGIDVDAAFTVADTSGNVGTTGTLNADGAATFNSTVDIDGNISSGTGGITLNDTIFGVGLASLDGGIDVDAAFTVADTSGNVGTTGTLNADGAATFNSTVDIDGNISSGTGGITLNDTIFGVGLASLDGGIDVDALFTVGDGTGNMAVFGTSDLQGNISSASGVLTFTDNAIIDGAADAIQLTVQGYTTQTTDLLLLETSVGGDVFTVDVDGAVDAAGLASLDGGIDVDALFTVGDGSGNMAVFGTSDLQGNISSASGVLTFTDNAIIDGAANAIQLTVQGYTTQTTDLLLLETSVGGDVFTVDVDGAVDAAGLASLDGGIDVDSAFTVADTTGNVDTSGTLQFGADNLYPMGYATSGYQIECGLTATFTDTIAVTASALTTATYAWAMQITDPLATACYLTVDAPAANVFNIDSWESDFTVGATGITVYWCAVGIE